MLKTWCKIDLQKEIKHSEISRDYAEVMDYKWKYLIRK